MIPITWGNLKPKSDSSTLLCLFHPGTWRYIQRTTATDLQSKQIKPDIPIKAILNEPIVFCHSIDYGTQKSQAGGNDGSVVL